MSPTCSWKNVVFIHFVMSGALLGLNAQSSAADCDELKVECIQQVLRKCYPPYGFSSEKCDLRGDNSSENKKCACETAGTIECINKSCASLNCTNCPPEATSVLNRKEPAQDVEMRTTSGEKWKGFKKRSVQYSSGCDRKILGPAIKAALDRVEGCLRHAFIKDDIVRKMDQAVSEKGIYFQCRPFADSSNNKFCAGKIIFSENEIILPPQFLNGSPTCKKLDPALLVHEIAHIAELNIASDHNLRGYDNRGRDEVYTLERYCMGEHRIWFTRTKQIEAIVEPSKLQCAKTYLEYQVAKDIHGIGSPIPFWKLISTNSGEGRDPCVESTLSKLRNETEKIMSQ